MNKVYSPYFFRLFFVTFMMWTTNSQAQNFTERPEFIKANSNWIHDGYPTSGSSIGSDIYRYDFNNNPTTTTILDLPYVVTDYSDPRFYENRTSVSDTATGDLLFFTNGNYCFNANYEYMPNGGDLLGSISANQGCLIIPVIDSPGKYYLFMVAAAEDTAGNSITYSVIDMSLDGGLGDIIPGQKNLAFATGPFQESIMAVPGNNCDVWLLAHPFADTVFNAFHITRDGLNTVPVVSSPGSMISGDVFTFEGGAMSVSPDRSMLAIGSYSYQCPLIGYQPGLGGLMVAKFEPETGMVSDGILINDSMANYSSCFSPDGTKLYAHGVMSDTTGENYFCQVQQYDVSNYTQSAITTSEYIVSENLNVFNGIITNFRTWNDTIIISTDLSYIPAPNFSGAGCNFQSSSYFPGVSINNSGTLGLDAIYPLPPDTMYNMLADTTACGQLVLGAPSTYTEYAWDDGSIDSLREVTASGTYWVAYNDGCHYKVDTFEVTIPSLNPIITVNVFELGTTMSYDAYQWMLNDELLDGATSSTYTVLENGDYQVIVSNEDGCTDTSAVYAVTNVSVEDAHYMASYVHVYPNPATDVIYIKSTIDVTVEISTVEGRLLLSTDKYKEPIPVGALAVGMYLIKIYDMDGRVIKTEKLIKNS